MPNTTFNTAPEAFMNLIDSTITIGDLEVIRNMIENAPYFNQEIKDILLRYLNERKDIINNENSNYDSLSVPTTSNPNNSNQSSMGGRTKSFTPVGSSHTSHVPYSPPPQEYDGGVNTQKAAFIAQALLLAGIGATVLLYVILVFTNVI